MPFAETEVWIDWTAIEPLLWVQSGFTVLTIVAFGTLTLVLHAELLRGDRAAMGLAAFIGVYWTARVVVDAVYFSHADWPKGKEFDVGHALLTSLFCFLVVSYWSLFVWNSCGICGYEARDVETVIIPARPVGTTAPKKQKLVFPSWTDKILSISLPNCFSVDKEKSRFLDCARFSQSENHASLGMTWVVYEN